VVLSDALLQPIIGWSTHKFTQQRKAGKKDKVIKENVKMVMTKASDTISRKWSIASKGTFTVERHVSSGAPSAAGGGKDRFAVVEFQPLPRKR
jgi:hypothetical protein